MIRSSKIRVSVWVVIEKDTNGFHAYTPALKGLHVDGDTQDDALSNAKKAIHVYLDSLNFHNEAIPVGPGLTVSRQVEHPQIPVGAFLQNVTIQWPYQEMSGIS